MPDDTIRPADAAAIAPAGAHLLFLSHAGVDSEAALRLARRLEESEEAKAHGLKVWIDKIDLGAGGRWKDALQSALASSTAFAVYVGSHRVVNWVWDEVSVALDRAHKEREYPLVPVLAPGITSEDLPSFLSQYQGVGDPEQPDEFRKLLRAVLRLEPRTKLAIEGEPFVGLQAYDSNKAHLFFGREKETDELVGLLRESPLVLVTGDSGSGKSSLVLAGLVLAFRGGRLARSRDEGPDETIWHVVETRPGTDPFGRLADSVRDAAERTGAGTAKASDLADLIRTRQPDKVRDAVLSGAPKYLGRASKVLVVVDQFEEFRNSPQAPAYVAALLRLPTPGDDRIRVVLTMRRDYLYACDSFPDLSARLQGTPSARYLLHRMSPNGLREVITRPLDLAGIDERDREDLARAILKDVGDEPGELALLQMALWRTWSEARGRGSGLVRAYGKIGRVEGALAQAADDVFNRLLPEEQRRAETLFVRLVRPGEAGGVTRRVARFDEFDAPTLSLADKLSKKEQWRLLTIHEDTIEIAHEELATQWLRYQRWIANLPGDPEHGIPADPRGDDIRLLQSLIADAARWESAPVDEKARYQATGIDLELYQQLVGRRDAWLSDLERRFAAASAYADQQEKKRRKEEHEERERLQSERRAEAERLAETEKQRAAAAERLAETEKQRAAAAERLAETEKQRAAAAERLAETATEQAAAARKYRRIATIAALVTAFAFAFAGIAAWYWDRSVKAQQLTAMQLDRANRALARGIWSDLSFQEGDLTTRELNAVWLLVGSDKGIRDHFGLQLQLFSDDILRFSAHPEIVGRAIGLEWPSPIQAQAVFYAVLQETQRTTDLRTVERLVNALTVLAGMLSPEQAQQALEAVLENMAKEGTRVWPMDEVVPALADKLSNAQTHQALEKVLQAVGTRDSRFLRQASLALAGKLTDAQLQDSVDAILRAMPPTDPHKLLSLARGVQALAGKLTADKAQEAVRTIVQVLPTLTDPYTVQSLADTLQQVAGKLSPEQAQQALEAVLQVMPTMTKPDTLQSLARAAEELPGNLTSGQAQQSLDAVLNMIRTDFVPGLAQAVHALSGKLTEAQAQQGLDVLLEVLQTKTAWNSSPSIQAVRALAGRLSNAQVQQTLEPLLQAIRTTPDQVPLLGLTRSVQALASSLSETQVQHTHDALLQAMRATLQLPPSQGVNSFRNLAQAVQTVPGKLTDKQAQQALDLVLGSIAGYAPWPGSWPDAESLRTLMGKLSDAQAERAIERLLPAMQASTNAYSIALFAETVRALGVKLTGSQIQQTLDTVLKAMQQATRADVLSSLGKAVQSLAGKVNDLQIQQSLGGCLQGMGKTTDAYALISLVECIQVLPGELTDAQAQQTMAAVFRVNPDVSSKSPRGTGTRRTWRWLLPKAVQGLAAKLNAAQARQVLGTSHLRGAFGWSTNSLESAAWAGVIATLLRRAGQNNAGQYNYVSEIVELIKYPTAAGQATNVLLNALHEAVPTAPGVEAGLPTNLRWLADTYPTIDLHGAPTCPQPSHAECPAQP